MAVVVVSLLWRLPSLFDPPWVNDEGTYFAVAQAIAHGFHLYADVWENKPPGLYLLYSAVYHSFGASQIAIRVMAAFVSILLVMLTYRLALRPVGSTGACIAGLFVGLLLGVPFLEGTTLNAELPLALFCACGMYAAVEYERPWVAGICMAVAVAFKAVAGFDALALGIWLLLHRRHQLPGYVAATSVALTLGVLAVWHAGILDAMMRDALLYDLGYVGHGNGGGVPWLLSIKVIVLFTATIALQRASLIHLWSVWAIAGATFSGRFFGHYALQAVAPLTIAGAIVLRPYLNKRVLIVLPTAFLAAALVTASVGWALAASGHDSSTARRLQYVANVVRYAVHLESSAQYGNQIDDHVVRNERVAEALDSVPPGQLLVWGNTPWIYVLSGRLPATAYTSAWRSPEVPGETLALRRALQRHAPEAVVVILPPLPPLGAARMALAHQYRLRFRVMDALVYVRTARR